MPESIHPKAPATDVPEASGSKATEPAVKANPLRDALQQHDILAEICAHVPADSIVSLASTGKSQREILHEALAGRRNFPRGVSEIHTDAHRFARMAHTGKAHIGDVPALRRLLTDPDGLVLDPARAHLESDLHALRAQAKAIRDHIQLHPSSHLQAADLVREERMPIGFDLLNPRTSPERLLEIGLMPALSGAERRALALHPNLTDDVIHYGFLETISKAEFADMARSPHASDALLYAIATDPELAAMLVAEHPNAQDRTLHWAMHDSTSAAERQIVYKHPNFSSEALTQAASRAEGSAECTFIREHKAATKYTISDLLAAATEDADALPIIAHPLISNAALYRKAHSNPGAEVKLAILDNLKFDWINKRFYENIIDRLAHNSVHEPSVLTAIRENSHTAVPTLQYMKVHAFDASEKTAIARLLAASSSQSEAADLAALARSAASPLEKSRIACNHNTPLPTLRLLARDASQSALVGIAGNPHADAALLAKVWAHPNAAADPRLQYQLAFHFQTPPRILHAIATSKPPPHNDIIAQLKLHESLPPSALQYLNERFPDVKLF